MDTIADRKTESVRSYYSKHMGSEVNHPVPIHGSITYEKRERKRGLKTTTDATSQSQAAERMVCGCIRSDERLGLRERSSGLQVASIDDRSTISPW